MHINRQILLVAITFNILCLMTGSALGQSIAALRNTSQTATTEEVIKAAHKAVAEGDWANAETHFREAVRLEPKQALWRIQLFFALGQQKKWKDAFKEFDKVMEAGAMDWVLTINKKLPDGKLAFVNTETFGDEKQGILRYVKAVKEQKKVDSVANDIGVKLDDYAKKNKLALTYDISKFKGMRFESGNTIDVTSDFIAYYNGLQQD